MDVTFPGQNHPLSLMEQLNYSFFLPVLWDRLLETDGRRSVHTLAGEVGCSRSADRRDDSCLVASRHLGNCLSLPNMCGCVGDPVSFWHLQLGACNVTYACTWSPTQHCRLGCMHQTCENVQSRRHDCLKVIPLYQCHVLPSLLLYNSLLKLMALSSPLLLVVSLLPANSLKSLVWKAALPAHEQGRQQGCRWSLQNRAYEGKLDAMFGFCMWVLSCAEWRNMILIFHV